MGSVQGTEDTIGCVIVTGGCIGVIEDIWGRWRLTTIIRVKISRHQVWDREEEVDWGQQSGLQRQDFRGDQLEVQRLAGGEDRSWAQRPYQGLEDDIWRLGGKVTSIRRPKGEVTNVRRPWSEAVTARRQGG